MRCRAVHFAFDTLNAQPEDAMQLALTVVRGFRRSDDGQDLLEYGLLTALIAIVALSAVSTLGLTILDVFWSAIAAASV